MNLPNKLTVTRLVLVPIMLIIMYIPVLNNTYAFEIMNIGVPVSWIIIDIIFIIASYTDHLDGKIARKNNLVTTFGKFLDPIADKILVITAMIMLVEMDKIPGWIPVIVIFREFVVSGYRLIASSKNGEVIAANIWGKIKTVTQMIAIIITFIDVNKFFAFARNMQGASWWVYLINILASVFMVISVIATIFSGWQYVKNGKDLLLEDK